MEWLKEQDRELGRIRTRIQVPIIRFVCRVLIGLGAASEVMLYVFTNEEMLKNLKEADFGFVGYYLEHGRRREWSKKMKEDIKETLDDEFDSDWIQSVMEDRMRLDV